jgi:hypothetical protein
VVVPLGGTPVGTVVGDVINVVLRVPRNVVVVYRALP